MINSWRSNTDIIKPDVADTSYRTLLRKTFALEKKDKHIYDCEICEENSLYGSMYGV